MKKPLLIIGALVLVLGLGTLVYGFTLFQPVSSTEVEPTRFVIPKGQAISVIGNRLAEAGYIKHGLVFRLIVKKSGLANEIQAGSYMLSPDMSPQEIAQALTEGSEDLWVTIPEGQRREEIAQNLAKEELPNYKEDEFLEASAGLEGKLFPETYLIPRDYTAQQIVTLLTNTFETKVIDGLADELAASDRTLDEILIMASILEREANGQEDLNMVAGVLWNRIEIGMVLQADATLQYAKGYNEEKDSWWEPPLGADRQLDSPFNTYQNPGLPPRPIANPGLAAIKAALNPTDSDYLFYIHANDGQVYYAETLDEHNENINAHLR